MNEAHRDLAGAIEPVVKNPEPAGNRPVLRLSPYAWAKLLYLRDVSDTEVGGFGITTEEDCLLLTDIQLVRQYCSRTSVDFDDAAVADFFDKQVDTGRRPENFARIWIHTHPDESAEPSPVDEETFARVFTNTDWAVMLILAPGGATYARLQFGVGPGGTLRIPVRVDFSVPFPAADQQAWQGEYEHNVRLDAGGVFSDPARSFDEFAFGEELNGPESVLAEEPEERDAYVL